MAVATTLEPSPEPEVPVTAPQAPSRGAAGQLVLISFLSLYLELTFIRWAPMQVRLLAYFSNYVLIAALLGLGLGMTLARSRHRLILLFPPALLVMVVLVFTLERRDFVVPLVAEDQFIWNYLADIKPSGLLAYGVLVGFFLAVTGVFVLVGQEVGRAIDPFPSLRGYSLNIVGAILGVLGLAALSFLETPPTVWFGVGGALLFAYLVSVTSRPVVLAWSAACLLTTVGLVSFDAADKDEGTERYWSPYYEIETTPILLGDQVLGSNITVNKDSHQQALDLSDAAPGSDYIAGRARLYDTPYRFVEPRNVLVVGAGTGNDVAAALRNAPAAHVDAVEIDPVIADLGTELHPERPYDADNVDVVIADARSYLAKSDETYDLIVFGFLDSHRLFSNMSSVRMDNYVYTLENFRQVRERLSDDGVVAVTFTVHEKWIADRIFTVMTRAFGSRPVVYQGDRNGWGTTFLIGHDPLALPAGAELIDTETAASQILPNRDRITWGYSDVEGFLDADLFSDSAELLTDDWPFLYMRSRSIPSNYLLTLLLTMVAATVLVWRVVPSIDMRRRANWNFFALGAAFALLETRAITEIALVFGSTWLTNSLVIGAILVMILLANFVVARWHPPLPLVYAGLMVALLVDYFFPLQRLLELPYSAQVAAAGLRVAAPMFFAGIIFARWFEQTTTPGAALGANLLGAVLGGLVEYLSLVIGLRDLYLLALGFYAISALFAWRSLPKPQSRGAPAPALR